MGTNEHTTTGILSTLEVFKANIKMSSIDDWVVPIVMKSEEAICCWRDGIRLLFIDGSHEYSQVKKDLLSWLPKLAPKGIVALHDSFLGLPGPTNVVLEIVLQNHEFYHVGFIGSITFAGKNPRASSFEQIRKRLLRMVLAILWRIESRNYDTHNKLVRTHFNFILSLLLNFTSPRVLHLTLASYSAVLKAFLQNG